MDPDPARPVTATLRNGLVLAIRAAQPEDRERVAHAVRGLSRESIYTRLFSYRNELTDAGLDRIMHFDPERDVFLLATIGAGADEVVAGGGRYVTAGSGAKTAEVAFVVEEDYQGLGIAGRLMARLVEIARARGIVTFEADVLPGNKAMLAVFERTGLELQRRPEDGAVHLTLTLSPRPN